MYEKACSAAVACCCLLAGASGCIAFRGDELAQLPKAPVAAARGAPAIGYRVSVRDDGEPATDKATWLADATVKDVLESSGAFGAVSPAANQRYVLDIVVAERRTNPAVATATAVLSTLTVSVLPLVVRNEYDLTAVLIHDGVELKRYRFRDHETDVGELFLAFGQPFVDDRRWGSTLENLVRHLARQMVLDGALRNG